MKIYILCFTLLMYSCGPSSEELGDLWFKYSAGKLKKELGRILTQKNDKGEEKYEYAPMYEWGEYMGNTRAEAAIYYYSNGSGQATMWHPYTGSVSESGSWKIQWAPATDASPYDSDIIFIPGDTVENAIGTE